MKVQVTAEGYPHTKHHADDRGFPHFYPKTYVLRRGDVAQKLGEAAPGVLRRSRRREGHGALEGRAVRGRDGPVPAIGGRRSPPGSPIPSTGPGGSPRA